jgi:hypothetical protein
LACQLFGHFATGLLLSLSVQTENPFAFAKISLVVLPHNLVFKILDFLQRRIRSVSQWLIVLPLNITKIKLVIFYRFGLGNLNRLLLLRSFHLFYYTSEQSLLPPGKN